MFINNYNAAGYKLIVLFVLFPFYMFSQENNKENDSILRAEYIQTLDSKLNVRLSTSSGITGFNFFNVNTKESVHFLPNERFKNTIDLAYRKINIGFSFSPNGKPFNDDDGLKGPTSTTDLSLGFTLKKNVLNVFYNTTKGYYILNTNDYKDKLEENNITDEFLKTPLVKTVQVGIENSYYFKGNIFSTKFARNQSEIQLKSVGSPVLNTQLLYSRFDGRNETFNYLPEFPENGNNFRYLNENYYALLGAGYTYNYIISKGFYVTGKCLPLIGAQYLVLKNGRREVLDKNTQLILAVTAELSAGYQFKNLYGGAYTKFGAFNNVFAENQLANGNIFFMAYIGYRFNAPNFLSRFFDKVETLLKK